MEAGYVINLKLNSKHFTYYHLNNGPPSAGQTARLHHFKLVVQAFFHTLKNFFNIDAYQRTYTNIDISAIGQYQPVILANRYISRALTGTINKWLNCNRIHHQINLYEVLLSPSTESLASTRESCLPSWQRRPRGLWRWDKGCACKQRTAKLQSLKLWFRCELLGCHIKTLQPQLL